MSKRTPEQFTQAIRAFVRRLLHQKFDGSISAMARDLKIQQSQLSDLLNERRSLGLVAVVRLADYAGVPVDEVIGRRVPRVVRQEDRRNIAAELADEDGAAPEAIRAVLAEEPRPQDEGRSVLWWARKIRMVEAALEGEGDESRIVARRRPGRRTG